MLFDIGWPEFLLIGVVALVVIGPKDLPKALRVAGYWVRKARTLSREFQSSIDQMIREAELDEMRQELKKATEFDLEQGIPQHDRPDRQLGRRASKPPRAPSLFGDPPLAAPAAERQASSRDAPAASRATVEREALDTDEIGRARAGGAATPSPPASRPLASAARYCAAEAIGERDGRTTTKRPSSKPAGCRCSTT